MSKATRASMIAALALFAAVPAKAQEASHDPREATARPALPPGSAAAKLPLVKRIPLSHHIFGIKIYVSDIDRAVTFYSRLFDMDVAGKSLPRIVVLNFRGAMPDREHPAGFALVIGPVPAPVALRNPAIMLSVPDLDAFRKRAETLGVKLDMVGDVAGFGQDPDGNWFEVVRPGNFAAAPDS